jgi:hypothetical protein
MKVHIEKLPGFAVRERKVVRTSRGDRLWLLQKPGVCRPPVELRDGCSSTK